MRYSSQREAVLSAVRSTDCHPDAEWVYREVQKVMPKISLATVYRNLKELTKLGLIDTVETENNILRFDGNVKEHIHFVCVSCGKVTDIFNKVGESIVPNGMTVTKEKIVLYGKCRDCNK